MGTREAIDPTAPPSEVYVLRDMDGYMVESIEGQRCYLSYLSEGDAIAGAEQQRIAHGIECTIERVL